MDNRNAVSLLDFNSFSRYPLFWRDFSSTDLGLFLRSNADFTFGAQLPPKRILGTMIMVPKFDSVFEVIFCLA